MAAPIFDVGGVNGAAGTTDITIALTIGANSNRVLYCLVSDIAQGGVTSVTWNTSEALTQIASGQFNTAAADWYLYRLIAPTAATANLVVVKGAAANALAAAFYDTDQTTPNDTEDEAEGSGTAAQNTVASATGDLCIAFCANEGTTTFAAASGETELANTANRGAIYSLAGGASLSFDITLGTSRPWVLIGLNLNAVAAAGGVVGPLIGGRLVNNSMLVGGRLIR